ncbi:uncharacterized protein LOC126377108 [Pectinophora gossypiella]|uniref:uncharacterized protein LOC126377108 n=1 Tax=Pectinophora gossypiella TaxID=13191 RepID=UPI00214E9749|nr:uncharacterized protein LOC126377108 [Pectinophora gossypiella]
MMSTEHPLLECRSTSYTLATVRRAFIVWLRCGRRNNFQDVCEYYHRLEAMEEKLPANSRSSSRNHEFSLFANQPPTSRYQQSLFPSLYAPSESDTTPYEQIYAQGHFQRNIDHANNIIRVEDMQVPGGYSAFSHQDIFNTSQIFKHPPPYYEKTEETVKKPADTFTNLCNNIEGLEKLNLNGTSTQDIVDTSEMINNYCTEKQVPLKSFLENFKEYSARCELQNTVNNVVFYLKRKTIHEELKLAAVVHKAKRYSNENKASRKLRMEKCDKVKSNGINQKNLYAGIDKMSDSSSAEETENTKPNKYNGNEIVHEEPTPMNGAVEGIAPIQEEEEEFLDAEVFNITNGEEENYIDASTSICEYNDECEKTETSFEHDDVLIQIDINLNSANAKMEIISSGSDRSEGEEHIEDKDKEFIDNDGAIRLMKREENDVKNNNTAFSTPHILKLDLQKCRKI